MRLIFLRHPETTANKEGLIYGKTDYPYTELGKKQLEAVVRLCEGYNVDYVISSPLGRALTLAQAIGIRLNKEVTTDTRLEEMNYGILEGLHYKEAKERHSAVYKALMSEQIDYQIESGESYEGFMKRVKDFINGLISEAQYEDETLIIVSHGGVIRTALEHLLDCSDGFSWALNLNNGVLLDLLYVDERFIINNLINVEEN